jgi:WD40 repeat protein
VVTGGEDGRVVVRHESNISLPTIEFDGDGAAINRVIFDGDGDVVVSANAIGQLCFWDARVTSARPAKSMRDGLSASAIWSLAQHPARPSMVASGASDGSVSIWDTRAERWPLSRSLAHAGDVWDLAFTALADRLASVGADGTCLLWELASGTPSVAELQKHETPLLSVAAHTSLNMVVSGAASGGLIATSF